MSNAIHVSHSCVHSFYLSFILLRAFKNFSLCIPITATIFINFQFNLYTPWRMTPLNPSILVCYLFRPFSDNSTPPPPNTQQQHQNNNNIINFSRAHFCHKEHNRFCCSHTHAHFLARIFLFELYENWIVYDGLVLIANNISMDD